MPDVNGVAESRKSSRFARLTFVGLLAVQLVIVERAIIAGERFASVPASKAVLAAFVAVLWLIAAASLTVWTGRFRALRWLALVSVVALSVRFYAPLVLSAMIPDSQQSTESMAVNVSPPLVRFLRELAAAQEQYRLTHRRYADSTEQLGSRFLSVPAGSIVRMTARGDGGWSARASVAGTACSIWVRDSTLRVSSDDVEGSPYCGPETRGGHQRIHSILVPSTLNSPFSPNDVSGRWLQHRADERRSGFSGDTATAAGYSWTTSIGGSIRASVSIAGNQVFAGAHGNGELVALSLDSGTVGFRLRAPNWVHHEPAVTDDHLLVGFGNNEPSAANSAFIGSPPSGVAAYDRVSGRERWRSYTAASVMATPVVARGLVVAATGGRDVVAWRLSDGAEVWRAHVPEYSPMGNPLVIDSLFVVGVEPATICSFGMQSGRRIYCKVMSDRGRGAGHASPTVAGEAVLQVYEEALDGTSGRPDSRAMRYLRKILGLPPRRYLPWPPGTLREQVLVALQWRDGSELWRVRLGPGRTSSPGHIAGTATVVGGIAYVPSLPNRSVAAVDTRTGRLMWSANVNPARGSVLVSNDAVVAATADSSLVILDAASGAVRCRQRLPHVSDRAGPAVSGGTGVLTLRNGVVMARPLADWIACRA